MSTRDLGKHVVELHNLGTLAITGEGTRQTLSAQEALELLEWLERQRAVLQKAAQTQDVREMTVLAQAAPEDIGAPSDERDAPVDEP